jgi:hypothetical protein
MFVFSLMMHHAKSHGDEKTNLSGAILQVRSPSSTFHKTHSVRIIDLRLDTVIFTTNIFIRRRGSGLSIPKTGHFKTFGRRYFSPSPKIQQYNKQLIIANAFHQASYRRYQNIILPPLRKLFLVLDKINNFRDLKTLRFTPR